jgi:ribosomal protein S27AE
MYKDKNKRAAYAKQYRATHKEYYAKKNAVWKKANKDRVAVHQVRNYNALKVSARMAIYYAIKTGKMQRLPCVRCGAGRAEGHHKDYAKKLRVIWLCKKHHTEIHLKK